MSNAVMERLRGELTGLFGEPKRYHEFWAWSLSPAAGLELHLYTHCPEAGGVCELWIMDPSLASPGPHLLAQVDSEEAVSRAIERVRLLVEGRKPPAAGAVAPEVKVRMRLSHARAGRRMRGAT